MDILSIADGNAETVLESERERGAEIVAIDAFDKGSLCVAGRLVWEARENRHLAIGSQGVEFALIAFWREAGMLEKATEPHHAAPARRMAVVSGSYSIVTAEQIRSAERSGFEAIRADPCKAIDEASWNAEFEKASDSAVQALERDLVPIVFTVAGPDDPSIHAFHAAVEDSGGRLSDVNGAVGKGLGAVLAKLARNGLITRGVIAGGTRLATARRSLALSL